MTQDDADGESTRRIFRFPRHSGSYTQISNRGLNDRRMTLAARGYYVYAISKPPDWVLVDKDIAAAHGCGLHVVRGARRLLQSLGYIKKVPMRDGAGKFLEWGTCLFEVPQLAMIQKSRNWIVDAGAIERKIQNAEKPQVESATCGTSNTTNEREIQIPNAAHSGVDVATRTVSVEFMEWWRLVRQIKCPDASEQQAGQAIAEGLVHQTESEDIARVLSFTYLHAIANIPGQTLPNFLSHQATWLGNVREARIDAAKIHADYDEHFRHTAANRTAAAVAAVATAIGHEAKQYSDGEVGAARWLWIRMGIFVTARKLFDSRKPEAKTWFEQRCFAQAPETWLDPDWAENGWHKQY